MYTFTNIFLSEILKNYFEPEYFTKISSWSEIIGYLISGSHIHKYFVGGIIFTRNAIRNLYFHNSIGKWVRDGRDLYLSFHFQTLNEIIMIF